MKILIVGSGLSGCSTARILKDNGHEVSIIEKTNRIGGLCVTDINKYGLKYEPFGARTFHSSNDKVIEFVQRFSDFNSYTHKKGMIIHNELFPFPITKKSIKSLYNREEIFKELENRPKEIDKTNFETTCISIFGKTLYELFIKNYTKKMWGTNPKNLLSDWAPKRLELRDGDNDELFTNQWQGLPKWGYSIWLENMISDINIKLNTINYNECDYDYVISTQPIDSIMDFCYGRLEYRSFKFDYVDDEKWENNKYGTINLPDHYKYVRKCNFKILHQQLSNHNVIQYQKPVKAGIRNVPMYPINTEQNENIFYQYLLAITPGNIIPSGRLGLYRYLDMDKTIELSFDIVNLIENLTNKEDKYLRLIDIRNKY